MARKFISTSRFHELAELGDAAGAAIARRATVERFATDGSRVVRFCLSDGSIDRMGDTINPNGWDLADFKRNPVALWAHNASAPPIGRVQNLQVAGGRLLGDVRFAEPEVYEFADTIFRLVKSGFINSGSVGFTPIEWKFADSKERQGGINFIRQSLIEFSIVPLPANTSSMVEGRAMHSRRAAADPVRELGGMLGRLARARRLRDALPPSSEAIWERVERVEALRRRILD